MPAIRTTAATAVIAAAMGAVAGAIDVDIPTGNRALYENDGPGFYMFVDRTFEAAVTSPWEGGAYGYTRLPRRIGGRVVYTKFHEGIDIKPQARDGSGDPTDTIRSIAEGRVAYANGAPSRSNYGSYVVVEHAWGGCLYYSLYAHLKGISVQAGQRVRKGGALGRMGYTGDGLNQRRAHLHLEIGLMASADFAAWYSRSGQASPNHHGLYNGQNLIGFDPAQFLVANRADPALSVPAFLARERAAFVARVPAGPVTGMVRRYPWLAGGAAGAAPASWEIAVSSHGVPLRFTPSSKKCGDIELVSVSAPPPYTHFTKGYIEGPQGSPVLTPSGRGFLRLIAGPH